MGSNILLLITVHQLAAILVFPQEKMSAHPSTLPICSRNFKCILLSERSQYEKKKSFILCDSRLSREGKIVGTVNRSAVARGSRGRREAGVNRWAQGKPSVTLLEDTFVKTCRTVQHKESTPR